MLPDYVGPSPAQGALRGPPKAVKELLAEVEAAGKPVIAEKMDATEENQVNEVIGRIAQEFRSVDILFNNAGGILARTHITDMKTSCWHQVPDVNLTSAFFYTRAVLPFMGNEWGRIIRASAKSGGGALTCIFVV